MARNKRFDLPGHQVRKVLRDVPNQGRTVLLTRFGGCDCVTRIWHSKLRVDHHEILHRLAAGQSVPQSPLPADLASDFEGYRVRASLRDFPWLPDVVGVGMLRRGLEPEGRPYISTRWIEGRPLHLCWPGYGRERRERVLREVLYILNEMHARRVLHGDVKAENVIISDIGTRLIDLDTLREVPDPFTPVEVSQITELYSSPEQSHERQAYLSSDLYAYGMLVAQLIGECQPLQPGFPPQLPAPWDTVLAACLREKPLDRPRTEELLRAVNGERANLESWSGAPPDEATVRVPDPSRPCPVADDGVPVVPAVAVQAVPPGPPLPPVEASSTERIEDPPAPVAAEVPGAPPEPAAAVAVAVAPRRDRRSRRPSRRAGRPAQASTAVAGGVPRRRKLALAAMAFLLLTAVGLARTTLFPRNGGLPDTQVLRLLDRLEDHKTVLAKNNRTYLAGIVDEAGRLVDRADTAQRQGAYALARVWQQGWQFTGATWDIGKFSEADKLTREAVEAGPSPEALLARAVLTGAACRLLPESYSGRAAYCRESVERSDEAFRRIDKGWLMVEALWNAVLVEGLDPDDPVRAHGLAVQHCESAREILIQSPINGVEMAEDCALVASRAGDMTSWLWWARYIVEHAEEAGKKPGRVRQHLFRSAHPSCSARAVWRLDDPEKGSGADILAYCGYMTELALGCPDRAVRHVCGGEEGAACELPRETRSVPWDTARLLQDRAADHVCERLQ